MARSIGDDILRAAQGIVGQLQTQQQLALQQAQFGLQIAAFEEKARLSDENLQLRERNLAIQEEQLQVNITNAATASQNTVISGQRQALAEELAPTKQAIAEIQLAQAEKELKAFGKKVDIVGQRATNARFHASVEAKILEGNVYEGISMTPSQRGRLANQTLAQLDVHSKSITGEILKLRPTPKAILLPRVAAVVESFEQDVLLIEEMSTRLKRERGQVLANRDHPIHQQSFAESNALAPSTAATLRAFEAVNDRIDHGIEGVTPEDLPVLFYDTSKTPELMQQNLNVLITTPVPPLGSDEFTTMLALMEETIGDTPNQQIFSDRVVAFEEWGKHNDPQFDASTYVSIFKQIAQDRGLTSDSRR